MVGWHHLLKGHEFEQAPGVGDGQGSLACCSPWGHKESDTTEQLSNNNITKYSNQDSVAWGQDKQKIHDTESDLCTHRHLICASSDPARQWRKENLVHTWCWDSQISIFFNEVGIILRFQWIKDFNVKCKPTMIFLKTGEQLYYFRLGKDLTNSKKQYPQRN